MPESRSFDHLYDPVYEICDKKSLPTLPTDVFFKDVPQSILEQWKFCSPKLKELPFQRLKGGGNIVSYRKYQAIDCSKVSKDCISLVPKNIPEIVDIVFPEKVQTPKRPHKSPNRKRKSAQTILRNQQTLTKMYEPEVAETGHITLEVNTVAAFIKPDDLIGMFEVRTIERARRRREYEDCLKKVLSEKDNAKAMLLLEAFEWEEWLAREEDIANCQNLRMEIMIKMFLKREDKNRMSQETRFKLGVEKITIEANKDFQKRQIQYLRDKRRLEAKHTGYRKYKRETPLEQYTNKASGFYGPQIRHGLNAGNNHFKPMIKKFDERIEALDAKINYKNIACKFEKINEFAVPKSAKLTSLSEKVLYELQDSFKVSLPFF